MSRTELTAAMTTEWSCDSKHDSREGKTSSIVLGNRNEVMVLMIWIYRCSTTLGDGVGASIEGHVTVLY